MGWRTKQAMLDEFKKYQEVGLNFQFKDAEIAFIEKCELPDLEDGYEYTTRFCSTKPNVPAFEIISEEVFFNEEKNCWEIRNEQVLYRLEEGGTITNLIQPIA